MTKHATHPHRCVACFSYMAALCNKHIKQLPCYPSSPSHSPQSQRTDNKKDAPQRRNTSIVSCGDRTRTCDLWVMSPTSYHCSTPRSFVSAKVRRISETTKLPSESPLRKSHGQPAVGTHGTCKQCRDARLVRPYTLKGHCICLSSVVSKVTATRL